MQQTIHAATRLDPGRSAHDGTRLNVLHVAAPALVGGLESVLFELARGHQRSGHRVHVAAILTPEQSAHPLLDRLADAGVEVHRATVSVRAYARERAFISQLCGRIRPAVVHTHGYRPDVIDGGVARKAGVPTVSTVHGFTRASVRGRFYEWLQRKALSRYDAVVAVSRVQIDELRRAGVPADRIHLVRNAWSNEHVTKPKAAARHELGASDHAFHIGWVGRLSREKGPDVLIEMLAHLRDLPVEVSIVGEGIEKTRLQRRARALGVGERIRWHGRVASAAELFPGFDAFVLSSRTEGTPIVLFEAMAAGVPIVATAVGGVPDVISPREATLVPPQDPAALAGALRDVHAAPAAATARAAAARERLSREFAIEPWLTRYEEIYRMLCRKTSTRNS